MFHILVADDDKHTRMLLRAVLENANYTVSTAANGAEALELLDREHIDLVVLDIMMPQMDGYEFTRLVRETDNALPILMVTAKHLPADEKKGRSGIKMTKAEKEKEIARLEKQMKEAAKMMEYEYAAVLRDQIIELRGKS